MKNLIDVAEILAKKLQLKIMKTPTGDEQVEDHALYFHPKNYSGQVLKKYRDAFA